MQANKEMTLTSAPNFIDAEGNVFLVRCTECEKENYLPAVATGQCAWCGFDANKKEKS